MKNLSLILVSLILISCSYLPSTGRKIANDGDLSEQFKQFLVWEAEHNKVTITHPLYGDRPATFEQVQYDIEHVDIDMSDQKKLYEVSSHDDWVRGPGGARGPNGAIVDISSYLPKDMKKYFIIKKGNKQFLRYYFHPLDTHFKPALLKYLKEKKVGHKIGSEMKGYSTASRSMVVFDPKNGRGFSLKTSTNATSQGVDGTELRPLPTRFAHVVRRLSDYFYNAKDSLRSLGVAWEPITVGFPEIDQGLSVRLMEEVDSGNKFHLSGFVFNDTEEAKRIAAEAGQSFDEFWDEAFKIKGRAMAEMALVLGFWSTSNHAQNFRWELDENGKLTGRVIYLDISDGRPLEDVFKALGNEEFLEQWKMYTEDVNNPTKGIYFSNFFRGDFGSVPEKYHKLIQEGIIEKSSELLGLSPEDFKNSLEPQYWYGNKNLRMGWKLKENSKITEALKVYLGTLSRAQNRSCYSLIRGLFQ